MTMTVLVGALLHLKIHWGYMTRATDSKEAKLYDYMLTGKPITHWEAAARFRMLDFRKAITRIGEKQTVHRRTCVRDGVRFKEYWLSTSRNSKAPA